MVLWINLAHIARNDPRGKEMKKETIDNVVCEIMIEDGPDRHIDGHKIITDFICALLKDDGENWYDKYASGKVYDTSFYWRENRGK